MSITAMDSGSMSSSTIAWPMIMALTVAVVTCVQIAVLFAILCRQSIGGVAKMTLKIIFGILLFLCLLVEGVFIANLFLGNHFESSQV